MISGTFLNPHKNFRVFLLEAGALEMISYAVKTEYI
jgi:hypothetical protein